MLQLVAKRLIDITAAAILLVVCMPLMIATALAVRIALGSPVLFPQQRVGKDDRLFTLYKFRSMPDRRDSSGAPLADEHRLTSFGRMLRATSLDELPELWNILKGDMSLVGPRPLLPDYLPYYSAPERQRHRMRPGLTGLAQVKGRNATGWDERLAYDVWYVNHWSLWLDLKIALATFEVVLSRRGIQAEGSATMPRFDDYARARRQPDIPASPDRKQ
jgi:lipopolysaccharide/colanic/teichoic acid biosynthesis glycosyltransferase